MPRLKNGLTPRQDRFATLIALEGLSYAEAYRQSYSIKEDTAPKTVWDNASKLAKHSGVEQRINSLRAEYASSKAWNLERIIDEASYNLNGAQSDRNWAAANGSLAFIGKATGLVTDKTELQVTNNVTHQLSLQELENLASLAQEARQRLNSGATEAGFRVLGNAEEELCPPSEGQS